MSSSTRQRLPSPPPSPPSGEDETSSAIDQEYEEELQILRRIAYNSSESAARLARHNLALTIELNEQYRQRAAEDMQRAAEDRQRAAGRADRNIEHARYMFYITMIPTIGVVFAVMIRALYLIITKLWGY